MSWLGFGGGSGEQKEESGEDIVKKLSSRIESATLLDDRRDSVRAIRSLSRKYRREVTDIAMGNLIELIKTESDGECLSSAIEAICSLVCADEDDFTEGDIPIAKETSIQLSKSNHLLSLFLDCFDKSEFKVKWASLRLLNALAREYPNIIQQVIQERPTGVSALVDCLSSSNELLRNTTLLLLINVAENSPILQKIIVFENCFEILLNVALSEGGIDNSPVSEDCLSLLLILLENNQSNVTFFCETALIPKLIEFIVSLDQDPNNWPEGKIQCGLLYLRVIRALVSPSLPTNVSTPSRKIVRNCSLLSLLLKLIMGSGVPEIILTEIIIAVAECIRGYPDSQKDFQTLNAPLNPPRPAMVVLLMSMVNSKQPLSLRLAVLYCTACWLHKNPDAQSELVDTLLPSDAPSAGGVTAGQLLCGALFSPDPTTSWLAATALSHSILNMKDNQEKLVRVQLAPGPNQPPTSLSAQLDLMLSQSASPHTRLGILQFLSCWCADSKHACQVLLQEGKLVSTLQLLIDGSPSDPIAVLIHGVACFLLGILGICDESDTVVTQVRKRPGPDSFLDKMAQVGKSHSYQSAAGNACPVASDPEDLQIFNAFTSIYRKHEAAIGRHVAQFEDIQAEIAEKREKNEKIRTLEAQLGDQNIMVQQIQALQAQIQEMELNGVKGQIVEESGHSGEDAQEEGAHESEIEKIQNLIPDDMKGEIDLEEIKTRLADQLTETVKKELEEKFAEEVKTSLANEIRSQLEEEVLAALELEVEEKLKEKVLQDLETERQTLEDTKNQFQQEFGDIEAAKVQYEKLKTDLETEKSEILSKQAAQNEQFQQQGFQMQQHAAQLQQQAAKLEQDKVLLTQQAVEMHQKMAELDQARVKLTAERENDIKILKQGDEEQTKRYLQQDELMKEILQERQLGTQESAELQKRVAELEEIVKVANDQVAKLKLVQPVQAAVVDQTSDDAESINLLKSKIEDLENQNSNFKEIIQELEQEIEIEKNNLIQERKRTESSEMNQEQRTTELAESTDKIANIEFELKQAQDKISSFEIEKTNFAEIDDQRKLTIHNMEAQLSKLELSSEEKNQRIKILETELDSVQQAPAKQVEFPADMVTLKSEYDELKKDQDDLLELLSDQQLKIGDYRQRLKDNNLPVTDEEDINDEI